MAVKCELGRMWYRGRSVEEAVFLTRSLQSEQASYIQTTDTPKGNVVWAGGLKEMVRTESVHESQAARNVVVDTGGVVKTEAKRAEKHTDVLPLDECTLVCKPDFGFDTDGSLVFDPDAGISDAGGKLNSALLLAGVL